MKCGPRVLVRGRSSTGGPGMPCCPAARQPTWTGFDILPALKVGDSAHRQAKTAWLLRFSPATCPPALQRYLMVPAWRAAVAVT